MYLGRLSKEREVRRAGAGHPHGQGNSKACTSGRLTQWVPLNYKVVSTQTNAVPHDMRTASTQERYKHAQASSALGKWVLDCGVGADGASAACDRKGSLRDWSS